ncbi:MAG: DUF5675 family protein [Flavisolibacter sp.]
MELELIRKYYSKGTNGSIYINGKLQCYSIELPWLDNQHEISCIPEGKYELIKRYSPKFKEHLLVKHVENRSEILMHPANNALKELKGCIAPVSELTGEGMGNESRKALEKLLVLIQNTEDMIYLTIKSNLYDNKGKNTIANTSIF